tara:strand:+ start:2078 stop:3211 length:1134 start_codon:yes stop_codon:yes gene_type:complete
MIKTGSDFSGVGAFDQALIRLGINYKTIFACDVDKYARQTYIENYGEPDYFPKDVYNREIPKEPLDLYMTSPPCQAFSLAGNRKGEDDKRGVLFYNSYEFIMKNKPRYFIFENVKGLLSDDSGKTFKRWLDYLGKSINGNPVIFPLEQSANYHIYYKVLNSKNFGVPQNRERVFIVGIRDDESNYFRFPKEEHLKLKLKDVLQDNVDDKYYLSESAKQLIINNKDNISEDIKCISYTRCRTTGKVIKRNFNDVCNTIHSATGGGGNTDQFIKTNNKRVNKCYETHKHNLQDGDFMDSYNNTIHKKISPSICARITATNDRHLYKNNWIRRLTPIECFRLQDFPETFKWSCSDSQAYKQAGNSITVGVLAKIIEKLNL